MPGDTTARGYGNDHQRARRTAIATYNPNTPCPRCGQPLGPNPKTLDLDHAPGRTHYLGLSHTSCNRAAGARTANSRRTTTTTHITSRDW